MPFASEAQRRYLWANDPKVAQKFVDDGAKSTGLPYHSRSKKRSHKRTTKRSIRK